MWLQITVTFVIVVFLFGGAWFLIDRQLRIVPGVRSGGSAISDSHFSPDYFTARARFRKSVAGTGGTLSSLAIDAKGPAGEDLTIDIGWFGAPQPRRVFLHSSGVHGVEGFAGSAIQLQFLDRVPAVPDGAAIVLIHGLNPYGMAWQRRVNENNVDLNRNFLDSQANYSGAPPLYGALNSFLNPGGSPWPDYFVPRSAYLMVRYGSSAIRQTVAGGQYEYPRGLFFGGNELQQGPLRVQAWLAEHLKTAERLVAVDVHTGLGEFGEDTLLVAAADHLKLRPIFGERVQVYGADEGPAYKIRGGFLVALPRILTKAAPLSVAQEFGTYHSVRVLRAMRDENVARRSGAQTSTGREARALKEAFCPDDDRWRKGVLERGARVMEQAMDFAFRGGE